MIDFIDIDPGTAGLFARALTPALADRLPVPIAEIMDPASTPEEFLPFLAAHKSVDLWFDNWPAQRKRQMIADATLLGSIIGTRAAAVRFLAFVDTLVVHKRSYPVRFPVGRIAAGVTPIQHPNFTTRFLLKVALQARPRSIQVGRSAVGRAAIRTSNREPLRRAKHALVVSKAPGTAYTATFAHRIPITLDDGMDLDAGHPLGAFRDRIRL